MAVIDMCALPLEAGGGAKRTSRQPRPSELSVGEDRPMIVPIQGKGSRNQPKEHKQHREPHQALCRHLLPKAMLRSLVTVNQIVLCRHSTMLRSLVAANQIVAMMRMEVGSMILP